MYRPNSDLIRQTNRVGVRFLLAEVNVGLTFLTYAGHATLPGSRDRCLRNAREMYSIVRRLLPRVQPEYGEELELHRRMEELRTGLIEAGCCPD